MATDYDAPRAKETDDTVDESLEDLAARRRSQVDVAVLDVDDGDAVDPIELPDVDLSGEELTVRVIPKQADEFTCASCFLVQHHSRLALQSGDRMVCADCV
ncbi:DUF4193 domain-containing protein [Mycobacterium deserti]|uniref:DUF4193 domain-containing protein n=1 Tax=Mycobacterium deserti TaxID=2978347 RepID=A0ABT2MB31_9MYCO|nr:DUF4193 domain-containing protein [Mycobacterium deserti]MCT7659465.1 DUF4193 domain-containing protein [Mycobacterium deserti]